MTTPRHKTDLHTLAWYPIRYVTTEDFCSCKAWRYRPWDRPCKHVRRYRAAKVLVQAQEDYNERAQL